MGDLEEAIYAVLMKMQKSGGPTMPSPDFIPCQFVPTGLTLTATHTASISSVDYTSYGEWVYIVAVGGGGAGGEYGGGGGGACFQGWMRTSALTSITIGAGGIGVDNYQSGDGGATYAGPLRVPGGTGGIGSYSDVRYRNPEPGAGQGGLPYVTNSQISTIAAPISQDHTAFGLFVGGAGGAYGGAANGSPGTSGGGGGDLYGIGGAGIQGPGGGGSYYTSSNLGGACISPTGIIYTPTSNGGAGILGNSSGITGGLGGGGGGAYNTGNGGAGAVLVYISA